MDFWELVVNHTQSSFQVYHEWILEWIEKRAKNRQHILFLKKLIHDEFTLKIATLFPRSKTN